MLISFNLRFDSSSTFTLVLYWLKYKNKGLEILKM